MKEYVEVNELLKHTHKAVEVDEAGFMATFYTVDVEEIKKMPRADVQEVVRGHWIDEGSHLYCSVCDNDITYYDDSGCVQDFNFCSYCGARMWGE